MYKKKLSEGLDYLDLNNMIEPIITIDEYEAKMGSNSDIVTVTFIVKNKDAGIDLSDWFEGGYDFILDAQVSEGEIEKNKFLVFVEMARRSTIPKKIIELLTDLKTLTGLKIKDWKIGIGDYYYRVDEEILKKVIPISPHQYRLIDQDHEDLINDNLNEMRNIAGLTLKDSTTPIDAELRDFISKAGL